MSGAEGGVTFGRGKRNQKSPVTTVEDTQSTPDGGRQPWKSRRYEPAFSQSRPNSELKVGEMSTKILTLYPTDGPRGTNHEEWKRSVVQYVSANYRHCVDMVKKEKYTAWVRPVITKAQEAELSDMEKELTINDAKAKQEVDRKIREDMPIIFDILIATLGEKSIKVVQLHFNSQAPARKWEDILNEQDLVVLFTAINASHKGNQKGVKVLQQLQTDLFFLSAKQQPRESLNGFEKRLDQLDEMRVASGLNKQTEEYKAAVMFKGVSPMFDDFKTSVLNDCALRGDDQFPKSMGALIRIAEAWVQPVKSDKTGSASIFMTVEEHEEHIIMLARNDHQRKTTKDDQRKLKDDKSNPSKTATDTDGAPKPKNGKCFHCKGKHFAFECPTATEEEKAESKRIYDRSRKSDTSVDEENVDVKTVMLLCATQIYEEQDSADNWQLLSKSNVNQFADSTETEMNAQEKMQMMETQSLLFPDALFLDTGAEIGAVNDKDFLEEMQSCTPLRITGSTPGGLILTKKGVNSILGVHFYDENCKANITSFSQQRKNGNKVFYNSELDFFRVYNPSIQETVDFYPMNGLYATNIHHVRSNTNRQFISTVEDNMRKFSKRQIEMAEKAKEFMEGHCISVRGAIQLAQSIQGMPLNAIDFQRAEFIWGGPRSVDSGKTKSLKSKPLDPERYLQEADDVVMNADIMFIDGLPFLISKTSPGGFAQVDILKNRKRSQLKMKVRTQLARLKAFKKNPTWITADGEGGLKKEEEKFNELEIKLNTEAAGSHVPVIENFIKTVKEHERGRRAVSPFKVAPRALFALFVCCVVMTLNYMPTSVNFNNMSPYEWISGMRPTYEQHFALPIGSYCMVTEPKPAANYNDVNLERAKPMIALNPTGSMRGAWRFFNLETGRVVTRDKWKVRPVPKEAVDRVAKFADILDINSAILESSGDEDFLELDETTVADIFPTVEDVMLADASGDVDNFTKTPSVEISQKLNQQPIRDQLEDNDILPPTPRNLLSDIEEVEMNPLAQYTMEANRGRGQPRRSMRLLKESQPFTPALYLTRKQATRRHGVEPITEAVVDEIVQMAIGKKVFTPVDINSMTQEQRKRALRTNLLLDEKFKPDGSFEKHKARLVAMEYKHMSQLDKFDKASPTPHTQSILMVASVAAAEEREVRKLDVSGAFLNVDMARSGRTQYILLNKQTARVVVQLMPEMAEFLLKNGEMYAILNKAMYGTGEASKLWNNLVVEILQKNGFVQNPYDKCVFNKIIDGVQCTILFHVDDFMLTSKSSKALDEVESMFTNAFEKITVETGKIISFVGMTFNFTEKSKVHVTQLGYIQDILTSSKVTNKASTPATVDMRTVDEQSTKLSVDERADFHSMVYKLLYLAKRTRPDILGPTQFLSTRVTQARQQDDKKLDRILEYLNETSYLGLLLSANTPAEVISYIDASYGVNTSRRGHTGSMITLGSGAIHAGSKEQSINVKSSCECELVGLSDGLSQVIFTRNFLLGQGYEVQPATVMQDNTSTINLAQNGMSNSEKTRHISIRYFFVTDRIKSGEIKLQHMGTEDMIADILTKPLQGELFRKLRDLLLGYTCL